MAERTTKTTTAPCEIGECERCGCAEATCVTTWVLVPDRGGYKWVKSYWSVKCARCGCTVDAGEGEV